MVAIPSFLVIWLSRSSLHKNLRRVFEFGILLNGKYLLIKYFNKNIYKKYWSHWSNGEILFEIKIWNKSDIAFLYVVPLQTRQEEKVKFMRYYCFDFVTYIVAPLFCFNAHVMMYDRIYPTTYWKLKIFFFFLKALE